MTSRESRTFAVIMAGGSGTRFWPASRAAKPKQLLPLVGEQSMLRATVTRALTIAPRERILVVTNERLREATLAECGLAEANVLLEPAARNTAPCLAWASEVALRADPDALIAVFASDHFIEDEVAYQAVLRRGIALADEGHIATVGIKPARAETGYGYLELGDVLLDSHPPARKLVRFVEKPTREVAEGFVRSGNFAWNSGQFFFRADRLRNEVRTHLPDLHAVMENIAAQAFSADSVREHFPRSPNVSIDHGVMEKTSGIVAIDGDFGWSDVGSWLAAWELAKKDASGNRVRTDAQVYLDSKNCFVEAPAGKAVCLIGVENLVVVDTGDALLVMPKERAQDVKRATQQLVDAGFTQFS